MEFVDAFEDIYNFLINGSYTFVEEIFSQLLIWGLALWWKVKLASIEFAWGVTAALIDNIGLSAAIDKAWGSLDSQILAFLTHFKVVDGLNMILNALVTRFIWGAL